MVTHAYNACTLAAEVGEKNAERGQLVLCNQIYPNKETSDIHSPIRKHLCKKKISIH